MLGFVGASQLDKTHCCQALRQVLPVHLHGKALPKLLQSFEFASWFAIFWICQNFVFWIVLDPCQTGVFIDRARPRVPSMTTRAANEDSESGSALLKASDKIVFPEGNCRMDFLGANRLQRVVCSKRSCGFSTRVPNGTCCRGATRTTKPCIGAFRLGAAMRLYVAC